jgi:hypothetical protein
VARADLPDRLMRLALSSAAAPGASFDELLEACAQRGLSALELESGHGDVLPAGLSLRNAAAARARAAAAGIHIAGLRLRSLDAEPGDPGFHDDLGALIPLALALDTPLLVPADRVVAAQRILGTTPAMAVLPAGPAALSALDALNASGQLASRLPLAWDADPGAGDVSAGAVELLAAVGPRLRHLRLHGGGPEASLQEGRGVGALMARLALAGFAGTIALAPSSPRYRVIWSAWLGRRGGWGCGSKADARELVNLETS